MKKSLFLAVAISTALAGCNQEAAQPTEQQPAQPTLDTAEQRISYGIGANIGSRLKQDQFAVDYDAFVLGAQHALEGSELLVSQEDIAKEMQQYQQEMVAKMASENKQKGEAFLAENANKEGVVTLESGLQYKVITEGTGTKPTANDVVEVNYAGTLIDGTEFDSSYKRGQSAKFMVSGVIAGWTEALQLMPVGSKWQLFIPSNLAYGENGGGRMAPNETLIFEVELINIESQEAEAESAEQS